MSLDNVEFQRTIKRLWQDLGNASIPVPEIMRVLQCKAKNENVAITWLYDDIYDAVRPDPFKRRLDASGYVEYLLHREPLPHIRLAI